MCPLKFNLFSSSFLMVSIPNISQNKVLNFLLTDLDIFEEKKVPFIRTRCVLVRLILKYLL